MATKLFDSTIVGTAKQALDFIGNILESSTEYSIIGKNLDGKILLWNEGARRTMAISQRTEPMMTGHEEPDWEYPAGLFYFD